MLTTSRHSWKYDQCGAAAKYAELVWPTVPVVRVKNRRPTVAYFQFFFLILLIPLLSGTAGTPERSQIRGHKTPVAAVAPPSPDVPRIFIARWIHVSVQYIYAKERGCGVGVLESKMKRPCSLGPSSRGGTQTSGCTSMTRHSRFELTNNPLPSRFCPSACN